MVFYDDTVGQKQWYALHTRCHHERNVSLRVQGKGIETFLPTRCVQRRWKDRKKCIDFPLFPGYLFVHIALSEKRDVIQTPGAVTLVGAKGPEPLPDHQISAIKRFMESEIQFDPYPYLVPGMEIEVVRGPLKHLRGVLMFKKNKYRLIINIDSINNSIATEIDAEDVQPI